MEIESTKESPEKIPADALVVLVWESDARSGQSGGLAEALGPRLSELAEGKDFIGKSNETLMLHEVPGVASRRVLLVGLGKKDSCKPLTYARAAATALRVIGKQPRERVVFTPVPAAPAVDEAEAIQAVITGAVIGARGADLYRGKKQRHAPKTLSFTARRKAASPAAIDKGRVIGEAVNLVRELVNRPAGEIYPASFVERAAALTADTPIRTTVLGPDRLAVERMNCILGVGQGSSHEPRLLLLEYRPSPRQRDLLALVGKGVTFDSGGLSIKPADGMMTMKCDMAGAATVVAATWAAARLRLPVNLLAIAPLVENMTSGSAIRPGDVLTARNGKTIEVLNTDAEGRLILADALSYAVDLGAMQIVDLATLTGACMVALGTEVAGILSNNDDWYEEVAAAADRIGERIWRLPLFEEYGELIESQIADMKNIGGRYGGAITAAKLLAHFVGDCPWVHLDIAGPAFAEKDAAYQDAGGTGFFVRSLIDLIERRSQRG